MKAVVNRNIQKDAWTESVSNHLKEGDEVVLENLNLETDLDRCYQLAGQFNARLFIEADTALCHFLTVN